MIETSHWSHSTVHSRFMGGRPPDKKSYLVPFSRYLHIYACSHDLMHILNIDTLAGPRMFSRSYLDVE